jgi:hypothetical protein
MNAADYKLIELVAHIYVNKLCCPMPIHWVELSNRVCIEMVGSSGESYPTSLVLGGWSSSDSEKRSRLLEQILFAYRHGTLTQAYDYVMSLDEEKWHMMDSAVNQLPPDRVSEGFNAYRGRQTMRNEVIKARCVGQEYWFIRGNRCSCGGAFETVMQEVGPHLNTTVDRIQTVCQSCGNAKTFVFENSDFYGRFHELMALMDALSTVDEAVKQKILKMAGPPMENTVEYIVSLGEAGDLLGLDYISDAIEHARKKAN